MSVKSVALAILALTGAALASEPAFPAGGVRAFPAARMAPMFRHSARAGILRSSPRFEFAHSPGVRAVARARAGFGIPPSPHGFATTTPLRPFGHLARRHHGIYHSGWNFPVTIGDDSYPSYIGTPYDPAEAFPVYGPVPAADPIDPRAPAPAAVRNAGGAEESRDACRAERVTVPAAEGERTITVVRC
jgi:hypothetical protein